MSPEDAARVRHESACESRIVDAAAFAQVAQFVGETMIGRRNPENQGEVRIQEWEADLLLFCINQAKFAAEAVADDFEEERIGVLPLQEAGQ